MVENNQDSKLMAEALTKWIQFSHNPSDKHAWEAARTGSAELGGIAGRLLTNRPLEDIALSSSLTELDGFAETLFNSPNNDEARRRFEVSLGDVEYRIKRLFGVVIRHTL